VALLSGFTSGTQLFTLHAYYHTLLLLSVAPSYLDPVTLPSSEDISNWFLLKLVQSIVIMALICLYTIQHLELKWEKINDEAEPEGPCSIMCIWCWRDTHCCRTR